MYIIIALFVFLVFFSYLIGLQSDVHLALRLAFFIGLLFPIAIPYLIYKLPWSRDGK